MTHTEVYNEHKCWKCGILYLMDAAFEERRRDDGLEFFCPNGHSAIFTETWKKRTEKLEAEAPQLRTRLHAEEDQRAAAEQRIENLKKRVRAGVCPFCKRSFSDLKRHMDCKHTPKPNAK